ncbi:MAG: glutathione S-transferase family protein [Tistlia sp.]
MKLYYAETLSHRKACAVARYLESPVEYVRVDLGAGAQYRPPFLALNPNGKVPVLETAGRTIWEADAIMCHLAREAGSELWPGDERQVEVIRWLSWGAQHFNRHAGSLYFEYLIKGPFGLGSPDAAKVEEAQGQVRKYAAVLDEHLKGRRWLVGETPSIADFAVAIALPYAEEAHIPVEDLAEVRRWHDRLCAFPAGRAPSPAPAPAA